MKKYKIAVAGTGYSDADHCPEKRSTFLEL